MRKSIKWEEFMVTTVRWLVAVIAVAVAGLAYAEDLSPKSRVELKRCGP
jgi:hypothetical protein